MIDAVGNPQSLLLLGGTSEIGLAVAKRFAAARPLRIVLAGRPSERMDSAAEALRATGSTVSIVAFDARKPDTHRAVIEKSFTEGDIDVALVAFGVLGDQEQAWTDIDFAREIAEVNYVAAVTTGVALAEQLRRQGHGSVVALSSVAAERPRRSNFVYGSTKAGMDAFYTGLREALRPFGVHVTVVRPGYVHTRMSKDVEPAPFAATADEVAEVIVDSVRKRREQVWAPAQLRLLFSVLRHLPRPIFRRLPG